MRVIKEHETISIVDDDARNVMAIIIAEYIGVIPKNYLVSLI